MSTHLSAFRRHALLEPPIVDYEAWKDFTKADAEFLGKYLKFWRTDDPSRKMSDPLAVPGAIYLMKQWNVPVQMRSDEVVKLIGHLEGQRSPGCGMHGIVEALFLIKQLGLPLELKGKDVKEAERGLKEMRKEHYGFYISLTHYWAREVGGVIEVTDEDKRLMEAELAIMRRKKDGYSVAVMLHHMKKIGVDVELKPSDEVCIKEYVEKSRSEKDMLTSFAFLPQNIILLTKEIFPKKGQTTENSEIPPLKKL